MEAEKEAALRPREDATSTFVNGFFPWRKTTAPISKSLSPLDHISSRVVRVRERERFDI